MAVVQDVTCHAAVVALYWAFTSLSSRQSRLGICLDHGQIGCTLAERQLDSAPFPCGRLIEAGLMAIFTGGVLNADSKSF